MVIECWRPLALISTAVTVTAGGPRLRRRGFGASGLRDSSIGLPAQMLLHSPCVFYGGMVTTVE